LYKSEIWIYKVFFSDHTRELCRKL